MNEKKFNSLAENRLEFVKNLLMSKGIEYSVDSNKLKNFDAGARITGEIREKVLWGFALKHLVSIQDIVDNMNLDKDYVPSYHLTEEKISDMIAYLILLEASITSKRDLQPLPF